MSTRLKASARLVAAAAALVALEYLTRHVAGDVDARVVRADFGISAGVAAVVTLLGGLFNLFGGRQTSNSSYALEGIRSGTVELGKSLTSMIVAVAGQVSSVLGVVRRFLERWAGKLYTLISSVVGRIVRILDKIFGPIIAFLDKVRVHLKKFYTKILKPIIDTIEFVRSVLRLLSLFGFDWSKKLDAELAKLEQWVLAPYEFLVTKLNEVSNWINRIVTLDGLLQRVTLLGSLARDVAYTNNLWWNSQLRSMPLHPESPGGGVPPVDPAEVTHELRHHFQTGNADISPVIRESIANVRINLRQAA